MALFTVIERQVVLVQFEIECESKEAFLRMDGSHEIISQEEIECIDSEVISIEEE